MNRKHKRDLEGFCGMVKIECPCYGCKDRCLLCHAHCEKYAKYSRAMSERAKRSVSEIEANSVMFEQKRRIRRTQQERSAERSRNK